MAQAGTGDTNSMPTNSVGASATAMGGSVNGGGSGPAAAGSGAGMVGMAGSGVVVDEPSGVPIVIVGGYDYSSSSYPLRTYDLNKEDGSLSQRGSDIDVGPNPSYLALAPTDQVLYVANESDDAQGGLSAARIAPDGTLTLLNHQTGSDGGFTYVAVDPSGRYALGASYNGGSVSVFTILDDGSLGPELDSRDFGDGAQSHSVGFDPSGQFLWVPNKGNDEIAQLVLDNDGQLSDNASPRAATGMGDGPRHIAVHPDAQLAFVINELASSMTPYQRTTDGQLLPGTSVSTLPQGFAGENTGAHVELSPDGRFVYGSNRGHDSIVVFAAGAETGALTLLEHEATGGRTPRDFDVDPQGDVLIVANQDSGDLTVFGIEADGQLSPLGTPIAGPPSPAAVQIVYLPE